MKILISADMEGTCGVSAWAHVRPPHVGRPGERTSATEYERTRSRMVREINAAVEGALIGGADEVIVNDAHNGMCNLIPEELHPEVRYIIGRDKPLALVQGVDEPGVAAVFFTGNHARAGTPDGPLAHTWAGWISDLRVDGVSMGEYGLNAIIAGHFNVPVALVTGDDKAVAQTRDLLGGQVVGVVVKYGYSDNSAMHIHPELALDLIRAGAEKAVRNLDAMKLYRLPAGATVELELDHQTRVSHVLATLPNVTRIDNRTISFLPEDGLEFYRMFWATNRAGALP